MSNLVHETIIENPDEEDKTSSIHETNSNLINLNKINRILDKYRDSQNDYSHLFNKKSVPRIKENKNVILKYEFKQASDDSENLPCTENSPEDLKKFNSSRDPNNNILFENIECEIIKEPALIDSDTAWNYFSQIDIDNKLQVEDFSKIGCFVKCFNSSKLTLNNDLVKERQIIFNTSKEKLDYKNQYHQRIIMTVYKLLTNVIECPMIGEHWTLIGFQGNNPKTDLRGVGMFGLLQLLYFCEKYSEYSKEILKYSSFKDHEFPMACLFLNFSFILLEALRNGRLISMCNQSNAIIKTLNDLYYSIINYFFKLYKSKKYTIHDISSLLKEIKSITNKNPKKILEL